MTDFGYLFILILLCLVWLWLHYLSINASHKRVTKTLPYSKQHQYKSFHAVSIEPCSSPCENVKKFEGKRFLIREATPLPVLDCTTIDCTCRYVHHNDRRTGRDRRLFGIVTQTLAMHEHRLRAERRKQNQIYPTQLFNSHTFYRK